MPPAFSVPSSTFSLLSSCTRCLFHPSPLLSFSTSLPFQSRPRIHPRPLLRPHAYLPVYLPALYVSIHAHQSTSDLCRGYVQSRTLFVASPILYDHLVTFSSVSSFVASFPLSRLFFFPTFLHSFSIRSRSFSSIFYILYVYLWDKPIAT